MSRRVCQALVFFYCTVATTVRSCNYAFFVCDTGCAVRNALQCPAVYRPTLLVPTPPNPKFASPSLAPAPFAALPDLPLFFLPNPLGDHAFGRGLPIP